MNEIRPEKLIALALALREKAYAPYSHFRVGAALRADDGQVFGGCNLENASYGVTLCAERAALGAAVSAGLRSFSHLAVASDGPSYCMPCGICRQALYEFSPRLIVLCARPDGDFKAFALTDLLPEAFG